MQMERFLDIYRMRHASTQRIFRFMPGGYSEQEPPDPISNSEVKMLCADGRVAVAMPE
jgi:hypothetical protein